MKLSKESTFEKFKELLDEDNDLLIKQIEYLDGKQFDKVEINGYRKRNFQFFMALILGGTSSNSKFLEKVGFDNTTWSAQAAQFVTLDSKDGRNMGVYNDKLKKIEPSTTTMNALFTGEWYDLKDKTGNFIFHDSNGKSIFADTKELTGEKRAKEKMKQIADFLIYGTQITPQGGFTYMTDPCTLLKTNKQLIMNGAPGTGKTYSARNEIADKLLDITGKNDREKACEKKIRMDMVQFHPSYDYTDFIEGIRPVMSSSDSTSSGNIGYTLKNGTFKRFCRRAGAIERIIAAGKTLGDDSIKDFLCGEDGEIVGYWIDWFKNNRDKVSALVNEQNNEASEETNKSKGDDVASILPPFLFIIDEINRAEISKVLGETMYCLDADYRGAKGKIATQYSSLATDESFFVDKTNDKFFIPSNVYIIGTMNDIDRSVEVFDFALRRRFAWAEIKAEDVMDKVLKAMHIDKDLQNDYQNYLDRISGVNKAIKEKLKLNRHYHLGPSYFAKISLYLSNNNYQEARKEVWNNHISQILFEYVKGKRTESEIDDIEKEFVE
ncbi:MAG: AAA family ATPase [Lachnospiraceae bacterium]|nr:AAA family ATPase [Lachnospiraceae bacterium]